MAIKISKQDIIDVYIKLSSNNPNISRNIFRKAAQSINPNITDYSVYKLFGSYTNLKKCALGYDFKELEKDETIHNISDEYEFNPITDEYRFNFLNYKNIGKMIALPKFQVYAIIQAYSNYDGSSYSIKEIADIQKLSPFVVKAILKVLKITHDDIPLTDEDISKNSQQECISDLLNTARGEIHNRFQKQLWDEQIKKAKQWDLFQTKQLNPYESIIKSWNPPKYKDKISNNKTNYKSNLNTYVVTISDLHFGASSNAEDTYYSNENWSIDSTIKAVENYVDSISKDLENRTQIPETCILLSLGDIIHSISGYTTKGTALEVDLKGPQQFKAALDSITYLISFLQTVFKKVVVNAVSGNHDYFGDWVLFTAIQKYFRTNTKIAWNIFTERWGSFTLGQNLFIMEHGYSPFYKSKVPRSDTAKESYIQRLIVKETQALAKNGKEILNNYFFMGDLHHYTAKDFPMFEFIQLPTCVAADKYADHLNLAGTRNKQLTFIFDNKKGLIETINHYLS